MAKNIWEETLQRSGVPSVRLNEVTEALTATLKQYLETHQVKNLAQLIQSLNPSGNHAESSAPNPYAGVREVVSAVGDLVHPSREALAEAHRALDEERKRHLETQLQLVQVAKENRAEELRAESSATQAMVGFLSKALESNNQLMKELVEAKIQAAIQKPTPTASHDGHPMQRFYDEIISRSLKEYFDRRMDDVHRQPSVVDQVRQFTELYHEVRKLIPEQPVGPMTDRLRHELELERIRMEERVKLKEIELMNEREKERELKRSQFVSDLKEIVAQVVTALQSAKSSGVAPPAPPSPAPFVPPPPPEIICPICGERFPDPGTLTFSCPRCKAHLSKEPPAGPASGPPPGPRPPTTSPNGMGRLEL